MIDPVAIERRERLENGQERDLPRLVAGDRGLVREPRLGEDAVGVDGGHPLRGTELGLALPRAEADLRTHGGKAERGRPATRFRLRDRGVAPPAVERQGDADAGLPHGIEAAPVHVPGLDGEVGLEVALRELEGELLAVDAGGPGAQLGKCRLGLRLQGGKVARLGSQGEPGAGDDVARHVAPDEPGELGQARLDRRLLLRAELLEAGDLHLRAEHVLLRALAHRVPRPSDALGLLPHLPLLAEDAERLLGEDEAPEGPAHARGDREALPLEPLRGGHRVLRGDPLAETALAGPGEGLAPHQAERRHRHLTEARAPAVVDGEDRDHGIGQGNRLLGPRAGHLERLAERLHVRALLQGLRHERFESRLRPRGRRFLGHHGPGGERRPGREQERHSKRHHDPTSPADRPTVEGVREGPPRGPAGRTPRPRGDTTPARGGIRCAGRREEARGRGGWSRARLYRGTRPAPPGRRQHRSVKAPGQIRASGGWPRRRGARRSSRDRSSSRRRAARSTRGRSGGRRPPRGRDTWPAASPRGRRLRRLPRGSGARVPSRTCEHAPDRRSRRRGQPPAGSDRLSPGASGVRERPQGRP